MRNPRNVPADGSGVLRLPRRSLAANSLLGHLPFARAHADGDGDGSGNSGGDGGDADKLTPAQEQTIKRLIDEGFNKAIGARLAKFSDKMLASVQTVMETELQKRSEGGDKGGDNSDGGDEGEKNLPESVRRRLAAAEKEAKEGRAFREQHALDVFQSKARKDLTVAVTKAGVKDAKDVAFAVDHFLPHARQEEDTGNPLIGEQNIADAVGDFFKTTQGKRMIPASDGDGSDADASDTDKGGKGGSDTGKDGTVKDALRSLVNSGF